MTVLIAPQPFKNYTCRNGQYASDAFGRLTVTDATDQAALIALGCVVESADNRADPFREYDFTTAIRTDYLGRYTATGADATAMSSLISSPSSYTLVMPRPFKAYQTVGGVYRSDRHGRVTVSSVTDQTALVAQGGIVAFSGYDIIILAGQSNMEGRGTRDTTLDVDSVQVDQYGGYVTDSASYQTIVQGDISPLRHPGPTVNTNNYVGIGEYIARTYAANNLAGGRKVLVVPVAYGGTSMVGGTPTWNPGSPGGTRYEFAISQANLAIAAAQAADPSSALVAIFWHQGETDGDNTVTTAAYLSALNSLIAGFRARITGAATVPFVMGSMVPEATRTHAGYPAIHVAHLQGTLANTNVAFETGPSGYTGDNLHFNAAGIRIFGPNFATALARVAKPEVRYNFDADLSAATTGILGVTNDSTSGITPLIKSDGRAGSTANYLDCAGLTAVSTVRYAVLLDAVAAAQTDCVVEWTELQNGAAAFRSGMTLRAQAGFNTTVATGRQGFLFQVNSALANMRIVRVDASTTAVLATFALATVQNRRYRASAIGTTLKFEYSDDGGANWLTDPALTVTDATYAAGLLQYTMGFGGAVANALGIEDVRIRTAI